MKRRMLAALSVLLLFAVLSGCSASETPNPEAAARDGIGAISANEEMKRADFALTGKGESSQPSQAAYADEDRSTGELSPADAQKLILSVNYKLETLDFETSVSRIEAMTRELSGYVEASQITGQAYSNAGEARQAAFTLRIPAGKLDRFEQGTGEIGHMLSKSSEVENVTRAYTDTEARLVSSRLQEERLLDILAKAEKLEDVLSLESALGDVRYDIERMEAELRAMDSLVSYSTVRLSLLEVVRLTDTQPLPKTLGERIRIRFSESVAAIGRGMGDFAVWLLGDSVQILFWLAFAAGVFALVRFLIRRKSRKQASHAPTSPPSAEERGEGMS